MIVLPSANYTAPNRINSAHLLSDEPVRCGNGLLYAIDRFIWPWDYTEILPGFNFGVNEAINLAIDVNHLAAA